MGRRWWRVGGRGRVGARWVEQMEDGMVGMDRGRVRGMSDDVLFNRPADFRLHLCPRQS